MSEVPILDPADTLDGDHPAAVLWDMDGTLVDTEPYWIAEEHALVELHGGIWTDEHAYAARRQRPDGLGAATSCDHGPVAAHAGRDRRTSCSPALSAG